MTYIMSSVGFLAKLKFSSEFCGKWGIRVECTVSNETQKNYMKVLKFLFWVPVFAGLEYL